jgi:hypothetical protein
VVAARQPWTPTGYAVLGLLSFGRELTGYELKQWADDSLGFFYTAPAMSQIYSELERLRGAGLVQDRAVPDFLDIPTMPASPRRGGAAGWAEETEPEPTVLSTTSPCASSSATSSGPRRL